MIIFPANERGNFDLGWLKTYHSFSFGDYYDPSKMGFKSLRVINEDTIEGGGGFATHGHRDMEILTYIISGALEHRDSTGNHETIRPGEVQRMTAGTGIRHSEFNHLKSESTHLLQIWILPEQEGLKPGYEQKDFSKVLKNTGLHLVASQKGREGSVSLHQDADVYVGKYKKDQNFDFKCQSGRGLWLQVVSGSASVKNSGSPHGHLRTGDAIQTGNDLSLSAKEDLHLLLFDLA